MAFKINRAPQSPGGGRSLANLPYEIRVQILELALLPMPECLHFDDDPAWLSFVRGKTLRCPSIFRACKVIYKDCVRIFYSQVRFVIHPDRNLLARLKRHPGRRFMEKLDLALECRRDPSYRNGAKHDLISFYAPSYLVDKLTRMFPQLHSLHLTICDTDPPPPAASAEVLHRFPVSWITERQELSWQNLITHVRYKLDASFTQMSLGEASEKLAPKFAFVYQLPQLSGLDLYVTTRLSPVSGHSGLNPHHYSVVTTRETARETTELTNQLIITARLFQRVQDVKLHRVLIRENGQSSEVIRSRWLQSIFEDGYLRDS